MLLNISLILILVRVAEPQCNSDSQPLPNYFLIEKCHKSTLGVIAKATYTALSSCQKLAAEKKGLSLNFSPPEVVKFMKAGDEPVGFTCEVLRCAEADGGLSLVNDTRYDYYSVYAKNLPQVNASCMPNIGMVSLLPRQNFTQAVSSCKNMSGVIVDIFSEQRTDVISQFMLSEGGVDEIYVGANSVNGSEFASVTSGEKLDCTTYRAWAPGHPRRNRNKYACMTVTRAKTWRSVHCGTKLPTLCELLPSGPYKRGAIFASKNMNETMIDKN